MGRETYQVVPRLYDDYNFDIVDVDHKVIVATNNSFQAPEGYAVVHSPEEAIDYLSVRVLAGCFLTKQRGLLPAYTRQHKRSCHLAVQ